MPITSREILIALVIQYKGDWKDILRAVQKVEKPEDQFIEQARNLKCGVITLLDPEYPTFLRSCQQSPFALFYYGDINLVADATKNVSIVGSRAYSEYGEIHTREIAGDLAERGYNIVSGLAKGIDTIAHKAAIDRGGKTIAVLGCGIDFCYPATNAKLYAKIKKDHLLLSEYPGNLEPMPYYFPHRNRIVAALSNTLVVTEAKYQSGSLTTALFALEGNSDVMCLPYPAGELSECNRLIQNGACLVENADDVEKFMTNPIKREEKGGRNNG